MLRNLDTQTACDILINIYRWVDKGFDPVCFEVSKLRKIFSSDRQKILQNYFIKHPSHRQSLRNWLKIAIFGSGSDSDLDMVEALKDVFKKRELEKILQVVRFCNDLEFD